MSPHYKKALDRYFLNPIVWDYSLAIIIAIICYALILNCLLNVPANDLINSTTSDISNIAFTSAGFVLTFLTLLITFKGTNRLSKEEVQKMKVGENLSLFDFFLSSDFYNETIKHLKNAIKSLVVLALVGYVFKLLLFGNLEVLQHLFNIGGVIIISMTLIRCLLVLTNILKLQDN